MTGILVRLGCVLCVACAVQAQAPVPIKSATVHGFAPEGWKVEQQKFADLNGDRRRDALILLSRAGESKGTPERILAVALRSPMGYELFESNSRLVPRFEDESQEDPMTDGELTVRPGGFDVKLSLMSNAGSYQMMTVRYRFRFDRDCFRLIGYDRMETNRGTLDTRDTSMNFMTGAIVYRTGNAESNREKVSRDKLKSNPRRCFGKVDSAATFDPLEP